MPSKASEKPLGGKSYGSIPHLIGSKLGAKDHCISKGQNFLATGFDGTDYRKGMRTVNDPKLLVIIQEKLDGTNVSVAKINGELIPLIRAGYRATSSPYEQHQLFAVWVRQNADRFNMILDEGERLCGEWLAMVHSIKYILKTEPFVAFDLMRNGHERASHLELSQRVWSIKDGFTKPFHVWVGDSISPHVAMTRLGEFGGHGATEQPEGLIYRVERDAKTLFLAKWTRSDFEPGKHLPNISGLPPLWNWHPNKKGFSE